MDYISEMMADIRDLEDIIHAMVKTEEELCREIKSVRASISQINVLDGKLLLQLQQAEEIEYCLERRKREKDSPL